MQIHCPLDFIVPGQSKVGSDRLYFSGLDRHLHESYTQIHVDCTSQVGCVSAGFDAIRSGWKNLSDFVLRITRQVSSLARALLGHIR